MPPKFILFRALIVSCLSVPLMAGAANVSMTANDASSTSSLTSAGKWSNAQAPSAANDYFSSAYFIRTPADANNLTFAGNSLTLQPPTSAQGTSLPLRSIIYKGLGGNVITINNLTNSGGVINSGAGNVAAPTFTGNLMTVVNSSTIQADQGSFNIGYPIAGSVDLTNTSGQSRTITYLPTSTNSAFTGRFIINSSLTVVFTSTNNLPGNPATPTPGQISIGNGCTLLDAAGFNYNNPNGGVIIGDTASSTVTINASATNASGVNVPTVIAVPMGDNGNNANLVKRGGSILTLAGNNTFSGGVTLLAVTVGSQLNINNAGALGSGTLTIGNGTDVAPAMVDNASGSAITLANNNAQLWKNNISFIGSSSLNMGSGTVTLATNVTVAVSNNNLTIGPVADSGAGFALTKNGAGTLTLAGGSSATGITTINNGRLTLAAGYSLSSTNISIASASAVLDVTAGGLGIISGQTLGGIGTVSGALSAGSGSTVAPGGNNVAGTLAVNGDLNLNGGALNIDLSGSTTIGGGVNDLVTVSGALNISAPTTITVTGNPVNGTYTLIQYGTFSGSMANFTVPLGFTITNNTTAGSIQLIKAHLSANLIWHGDGTANVWDFGTNANWYQSGTNQLFYSGDLVTFDNTGSASPAITLAGSISPGATTVNSAQNYDFIGAGILSGTLTKSGTGTLILENNNTYSGSTVISNGVLQVGNGGSSGTLGAGTVTNMASLAFNRSDVFVVSNTITGTGSVMVAGTGDLSLTGSNNYSGTTTISSTGTLRPKNGNALGSGGLVSTGGGKLYIDVNADFPSNSMTLGGGVIALEKGGAGATTLGGPVTLNSDTALSVDGGATLNFTNTAGIDGSAVNANLTLTGSGAGNISGPLSLGAGNVIVSGGTWAVGPSNSYSGLTTINGGTLLVSGSLSLPPPASFNASQVTLNGGNLGATTNVTLNDGRAGITLSANSGIVVNSNITFTISNDISGVASLYLTKTGAGKLILNGTNDMHCTLNIDGNGGNNDGMTVIASPGALANLPAIQSQPFIYIRNNNGGSSTLGIDGTQGDITIAPDIGLSGRNVPVPAIENLAGNNTISGNIALAVGGIYYIVRSDGGNLTLSAPLPYSTPTSSGRIFTFTGAGTISMSGVIQDGSNNGTSNVWNSVIKSGTGLLNLSAANTYSGSTVISNGFLSLAGSLAGGPVTVSGGLLLGNGSIAGPVTVQPSGAIEAGTTNAIGTLTLAGNLTLSGSTIAKINKTAGTHDLFAGQSGITYGGTLVVTNLGGVLTTNDSFVLFSPGTSTSNFTNIIGSAGSGLAYSFTNGVLKVISGMASNPTNITFSVSGSVLTLSWPSDHLGWILQAQTNALNSGLGTNWVDISSSGSVTQETFTASPSNPSVFYRLRHP